MFRDFAFKEEREAVDVVLRNIIMVCAVVVKTCCDLCYDMCVFYVAFNVLSALREYLFAFVTALKVLLWC